MQNWPYAQGTGSNEATTGWRLRTIAQGRADLRASGSSPTRLTTQRPVQIMMCTDTIGQGGDHPCLPLFCQKYIRTVKMIIKTGCPSCYWSGLISVSTRCWLLGEMTSCALSVCMLGYIYCCHMVWSGLVLLQPRGPILGEPLGI